MQLFLELMLQSVFFSLGLAYWPIRIKYHIISCPLTSVQFRKWHFSLVIQLWTTQETQEYTFEPNVQSRSATYLGFIASSTKCAAAKAGGTIAILLFFCSASGMLSTHDRSCVYLRRSVPLLRNVPRNTYHDVNNVSRNWASNNSRWQSWVLVGKGRSKSLPFAELILAVSHLWMTNMWNSFAKQQRRRSFLPR